MKRARVERYDLDKTYFLTEYQKAVDYGNQNIRIAGVKEQLDRLDEEKKRYFESVASITTPEREIEQEKYQKYEILEENEKKYKTIELVLIAVFIFYLCTEKYLPTHTLVAILSAALLLLAVFLAGPIAFIVSMLRRKYYGTQYQNYIAPISAQIVSLGNSFQQFSRSCYKSIDNLYLSSLNPTERELILLRREQQRRDREAKRRDEERHKLEMQRLAEEQRTRQATEELLAIEKERERRYRGW